MITLSNIKMKYGNNIIFDDLNLKINQGEFVAIYGESGKGKTTLLNIIGMIEEFQAGELIINGAHITGKLKEKKSIKKIRRNNIGYLFQNFALMPDEDIYTNLKIPFEYEKISKNTLDNKMKKILEEIGIDKELSTKIYTLSGGQQQRVALARLLLKEPSIILADEPTGSLDKKNSKEILSILKKLNEKNNVTIIIVTHDEMVKEVSTRVIDLN